MNRTLAEAATLTILLMTSIAPVRNPHIPHAFPAWWASDWGQDKVGLWMAFTYQDVRQMFRWIEPGGFQMGSLVSEVDRHNNERPHQVTLSQGYWLAETACTQDLWQLVMGDNPSTFKENNNPVEQVSWDNTQQFIETLNVIIPGLSACLPTEAQWEYACRAGTETPFSFGETITSEQVNYDGNYPYAGSKKDLYRPKTVPVKSLPVNPWGLCEMHGNVWEWCQDWYGDYPAESATDPVGPKNSVGRVLRGGSWYDLGRRVRSASRFQFGPSVRGGYIGFRLALGQTAGIHPDQASRG
jgi:formylglycine-generating enzyme required for sulfatase activity